MSNNPPLILLIDDDIAIRNVLRAYFSDSQYQFIEALTAVEGLRLVAEAAPDIVLVDLTLPDLNGAQVIQQIRSWSTVPIIVISGTDHENLKVKCLDEGADDYVTKPFSVAELFARISVALRNAQSGENHSDVFEQGPLKIDFAKRRVFVNEQEVHMTPIEFNLLKALAKHSGKVVTSRQLLIDAWGQEYSDELQYLRVYMGYLRRKLGAKTGDTGLIQTEHRVGYRLML